MNYFNLTQDQWFTLVSTTVGTIIGLIGGSFSSIFVQYWNSRIRLFVYKEKCDIERPCMGTLPPLSPEDPTECWEVFLINKSNPFKLNVKVYQKTKKWEKVGVCRVFDMCETNVPISLKLSRPDKFYNGNYHWEPGYYRLDFYLGGGKFWSKKINIPVIQKKNQYT